MKKNQIIHEEVDTLPMPPKATKKSKVQAVPVKIINKSTNEIPQYATPDSAGVDVCAYCIDDKFMGHAADWDEKSQCVRIFSGGRALIHTGLYLEIPKGYECQVRPRSGLALKQGITVLNTPGTIDADYRGEVGIILVNLSNECFEVKTGDRIAQLVFNKVEHVEFEVTDQLEETERGEGGFGHTGK